MIRALISRYKQKDISLLLEITRSALGEIMLMEKCSLDCENCESKKVCDDLYNLGKFLDSKLT